MTTTTTRSFRGMQVVAVASILLFLRLHTLEFSILPLLADTQTSQQFSFQFITFIDVRKSRGKHVKRLFAINCGDNCNTTTTTSSVLSRKVKGYLHVKPVPIPTDALEQADAYLYNVRHPMDRILAWYQHEHPSTCNKSSDGEGDVQKACATLKEIKQHPNGTAGRFYQKCFPTIHFLISAFDNTTNVSPTCKQLAYSLIENKLTGPGFSHSPFKFDLQYYAQNTIDVYPNKSVLVLRTESIWKDLQDLEEKLGGKTNAIVPVQEDENDDVAVDTTTTRTSFAPLCCSMWNEMQTYRRLMDGAVNLNFREKKETLLYAAQHCGFSSWNNMDQQCHRITSTRQEPSPFSKIMMVDIRKSKGSAVRMNFQAFCNSKPSQCSQAPMDSVLSQSMTGYMHGKGHPPLDMIRDADSYLYNVRHPVDRLLALYHYDDVSYEQTDGSKGELARHCFDSNRKLNANCTRVALHLLSKDTHARAFQKLEYYVHLTMDTYPNKPVLVVRTESLWQDLVDLDTWLGGSGIIGEPKQALLESWRDEDQDTADYASICCGMQDEIHTYRRVLERAVNLNPEEQAATIEQAPRHCGFASWSEMEHLCKTLVANALTSHPKDAATQSLPSTTESSTQSPLSNIVFVHVGKAGGQTLRVLFKVFCESDRTNIPDECATAPDSVLSNKTIGYIHPKEVRPQGSIENANAFLYNLRHPVDRMISWYHYEHPQSCLGTAETRLACRAAQEVDRHPNGDTARFFVQCFPTIDLLSQAFNHSTLSLDCVQLAHDVLEGKIAGRGFKHIFYNMHYYTNLTLDQYADKKVLIVRTESLWQDFKDLDVQLGGSGNFGAVEGTRDSHGSETYKRNVTTVSLDQYSLLCCALRDEMEIYRHLMKRAVNLKKGQKEITILNAANKCGFSSWKEMKKQCNKTRIY